MDYKFVIRTFEERPALICFIAITVVMLFIRAPFSFYIGMSTDAYNNGSALPPYELLASQGRHGAYVLMMLMKGLGIYGPYFQLLNVVIGIAALSGAAYFLFRTVLGGAWMLILLGSVLFLSHPYQAEIFTFRDAIPFYATASLLGCAGYYLASQETVGRVTIGILLIIAGLTIYQSFLNFLAVAWLVEGLIAVTVPSDTNASVARRRKLFVLVGSVASSVLGYFLLTKVLNLALGTNAAGRATLIGLEDAPKRAIEVWGVIKQFLRVDLITPAPLTSLIIAALVLTMAIAVLVKGRSHWRYIVLPTVAALVLFSSVGVISVGKDFWPMPRTLVAVALIPAFAACILSALLRSSAVNRAVATSSAIVLVSFMGIGNLVATEQVRMNKRDAIFAATLAARTPIPPGSRLAIVGGPSNVHGLSTVRGDMNISAYWPLWSKTRAVSEFLGYDVQSPTEQDWVLSQRYCSSPTSDVWPSTASTSDLGQGLTVVCLSRP